MNEQISTNERKLALILHMDMLKIDYLFLLFLYCESKPAVDEWHMQNAHRNKNYSQERHMKYFTFVTSKSSVSKI